MEPRREDTDLVVELRALRPQPRPEFVAELDARAAAGFPSEGGDERALLRRLTERLPRVPRRRVPALAGALAVATIAIATAVVALSEDSTIAPSARNVAATPQRLERTAGRPLRAFSGRADTSLQRAFAPLDREVEASSSATGFQDGAGSYGAANSASGVRATRLGSSGPNAFLADRRDVERSARLVLATEPTEVREAAALVLETVHGFDGIVLRSSISAGNEDEANASFALLIPSGKLGDALAAFSEIAAVRSRRESTGDVTGRATGLEERLRDSRARIASLLAELAGADTETARNAVEAQLRSERGRLAAMRSALQNLERRVNLSRVSLRIESGSPGTADDGSWGVSDALDDAGRVLAIAAGVTLIGLAVLAPLALLASLAWFVGRALARRRREGVLD
ncbi:MAG TPA: DUF4349 domain-containing protein [Solirubrobacterales bacterium]|nr:DUF4349 domain-containing protein [Solirubrobacterales bacterium]